MQIKSILAAAATAAALALGANASAAAAPVSGAASAGVNLAETNVLNVAWRGRTVVRRRYVGPRTRVVVRPRYIRPRVNVRRPGNRCWVNARGYRVCRR